MHLRPTIPVLACAGLLLAALPSGAAASSGGDAPTVSHSTSRSGAVSAAAGTLRLPQVKGCKSNIGTDTGTAVISTQFTDLGGFSAIADDFTCSGPRKARTLKFLTWLGSIYQGHAHPDSFNVRVFENDRSGAIDEPGRIRCEFLEHGYTYEPDAVTAYEATFPGKACVLKRKATYWLSIQAVLSFGEKGQWGWEAMVETNSNAADFLEDGLFGTECRTWANDLTLEDCIIYPGDFIFLFK